MAVLRAEEDILLQVVVDTRLQVVVDTRLQVVVDTRLQVVADTLLPTIRLSMKNLLIVLAQATDSIAATRLVG
jgi:hypothetical protein